MVAMKDIATACGVSIATVSKALNDQSDIGKETKEHIRSVAEKMGYFPNSAAKALKTNITKNIGVLFADDSRSGLTHDYFSHVLDSFKRRAEKSGFDITFISNTDEMSYLAHARYRGFDGVVIACVDFYDPEVEELVRSDIPVVTIDHIFNNRIAIVSDNSKGMKDLFTFCYNKGHRKIAYIHGMDSSVTQNRVSSFYRTAESLDVEIPENYIREAAYRDTDETYEITKELLRLADPPTCILYPDDLSAIGGMNAIRESGLKIPEDVSVAGFDGIPIASKINPPLTTLAQDTESIGSMAASKLIDLITNPRSALIEQVTVEGAIVPGGSVAAPKIKK
ncbi:MAG: LacI family transcriptional regulator [Butyrivibrio sp.]|nr:LacI family transcriptional regulator [Butyrivibrio sp.]